VFHSGTHTPNPDHAHSEGPSWSKPTTPSTSPPPVSPRCLAAAAITAIVASVLGVTQGTSARGVYWAGILGAVSLYGAVMAFFAGLGKSKTGPGMALLVAGGTALCCGMLVDPSIATRIIGRGGQGQSFGGIPLILPGAGMLGAGLTLIALAALAVLARSWKDTSRPVLLAIVWLIPAFIALSAPLPVIGALPGAIGSAIANLPPVLAPVAYLVIGAVVGLSVAVGGGLLIRALEQGIAAGFRKAGPDTSASPA